MNQTIAQTGLEESRVSVQAMESAMDSFARTTLDDMLAQQSDLMKQADEASKLGDAAERAARLEIINANMDSLLTKIGEYREDTAELIAGLEAVFERLGHDLSALQKPSPEDLLIVQKAEEHLASLDLNKPDSKSAKERLRLSTALTDAQSSWNIFTKGDAVASAERAITQFDAKNEEAIAAAKVAIEEAKAEVERLRRKRIREAEFDAQFERFIMLASQIQAKLLENVQKSEARMASTKKELSTALTRKEELAKEVETLLTEIESVENEVMSLESQVASATSQAQRAALETQLGEVQQKLADLTGTKQEKEIAFNSYEAAATKHAKFLDVTQVQRDNQRSHARKLSIDSKARFEDAQNIVMVIQNTAQEDAASRIHSVGSSLDRIGLQTAARALIASERERLEMYRGHEKDMQAFASVTNALAAGRAQLSIEEAEIAARMRENFGIDPLQSSWLHMAEGMSNDSADKAA